jgi:hypothetical protein
MDLQERNRNVIDKLMEVRNYRCLKRKGSNGIGRDKITEVRELTGIR